MKRIIILCIAALSSGNTFSQGQNINWVFGDSLGINFSGGVINKFVSSITSFESCATISDAEGSLLFYTDGENVWDQTHNIMPNGDSLEIGKVSFGSDGSSITQGVIILPMPASETKYYIFYISEPLTPFLGYYGIKYSVVDILQHGGYGDVIEKNTQLTTDIRLYEKFQAVKHGNGRDWWLVSLASNESAVENDSVKFVKYLITPSAIEGPYFQTYFDLYHLADGSQFIGQAKFNPSGDKIAITKGQDVDLFNFNRCSGLFSDYYNIDTVSIYGSCYGIEFSPDGRLFYVTSLGPTKSKLIQFCLTCAENIQETKNVIYQGQWVNMDLGQLQLSPYNKIYFSAGPIAFGTLEQLKHSIYTINDPNIQGIGCNLDTLTVTFEFGSVSYALPNMPNYNLGPLVGSECDTLLAISNFGPPNNIRLYPNPATDHIYIEGYATYSNFMVHLHMYNILGDEVFNLKNIILNNSIALPVLPGGIYEIVLENKDRVLFADKLVLKN